MRPKRSDYTKEDYHFHMAAWEHQRAKKAEALLEEVRTFLVPGSYMDARIVAHMTEHAPPEHRCGVMGFSTMHGNVCEGCEYERAPFAHE